MLTQDEARARVARGAAHLDQVRPGWHDQIDVGTLGMMNCQHCIVGQLCGEYEPYRQLGLGVNNTSEDNGFFIPSGNKLDIDPIVAAYRLLQDAWIEAIADRRLKAEAETPLAEPVSA